MHNAFATGSNERNKITRKIDNHLHGCDLHFHGSDSCGLQDDEIKRLNDAYRGVHYWCGCIIIFPWSVRTFFACNIENCRVGKWTQSFLFRDLFLCFEAKQISKTKYLSRSSVYQQTNNNRERLLLFVLFLCLQQDNPLAPPRYKHTHTLKA